MEYEVVLTDFAKQDLFEIYYYVAVNDSFPLADKLYDRLIKKCRSLLHYPERGSKVREISDEYPNLQQLISIPYRIIYKVSGKVVNVLAILDGRRDFQSVLEERMLR